MRCTLRCAIIMLALGLSLSLTLAAGELSTGAFLQQLAGSAGLPAASPAEAQQSLTANGLVLPTLALDQPLTEATLVTIATAGGLQVTTSQGNNLVGATSAAQFVSLFGDDLIANHGGDGADEEAADPPPVGADPRTKGKGKKKGLNRSPSEPM